VRQLGEQRRLPLVDLLESDSGFPYHVLRLEPATVPEAGSPDG